MADVGAIYITPDASGQLLDLCLIKAGISAGSTGICAFDANGNTGANIVESIN
jgi:F0F1-type ATP synthase membrane subunit c/vacuolar-type H+-ATPase subunit K